MKKFLLIFFVIVCAGINPLFAQYTNVLIDNGGGPNEPSIAIDPVNPSRVYAGSNLNNRYRSIDGGATWISGALSSSFGTAGDPCLTADSAGNLFYFHLTNSLDKVVCQKSINGGLTYNNGSYTWNNNTLLQDKEWATVDPHTGNLYVTWSEYDNGFNPGPTDSSRIFFAKSTDHGSTFTNGVRLNEISGDCLYLDITDPHPLVGPNGELFVTFMDSAGIRFNKSVDFGATWLASQPLIAPVGYIRYDSVPGVNRIRSMPYSACDRSTGAHHGSLYVSWADQRNGMNNSDVFFIKSTDGGNTWTAPLKINSDNSDHQQYRNAMTVDQTSGYIYIVYYDRRNYINNDSTDVFLARSTDGGTTWTDVKISNSGFYSPGIAFDGDYIDIAAHAGIVRPVWTRTDNFVTSIWTCLYNESTAGISSTPSTNGSLSFTVNPNPANVIAAVSFSNEAIHLVGMIMDAAGRVVKTFSLNHEREKVIDISDLSSGIYFVKADAVTRKLIIQK